ncbi:CCA tRNA nucleotidyltransferase 1, mitochondrial [Trichinella papuae]|uniref:CCA tRNA nucleotidyltransferase 1, mitochondrial n=1 Tax=Trichinella papuae TaxID=268474 RepID=A0A0V1N222_9BILA|nr:CCA tRNA nucleotidyltransferase 1, mitochondrial [Trichinella papuae]
MVKSFLAVRFYSHVVKFLNLNIISSPVTLNLYLLSAKRLQQRQFFFTMKIEGDMLKCVLTPPLMEIKQLFEKKGYEIRIAGGAVRDLLLNIIPVDIDLATTARPEEMNQLFLENSIRMLNKGGEKHGTVTCRIQEQNFEITTLRVDKSCHGRHAEVEFTTDWFLDANRRDLTVNSMFMDFDGTVYDYFGGVDDLKNRRILFVGDPNQRIQEDYLRILRYFRFYGRLSDKSDEHDLSTLSAIKHNAEGLSGISGERIWLELKRIVVGRHADSVIATMFDCGIYPYIGLPKNPMIENFAEVFIIAEPFKPLSITMISALLENEQQICDLNSRLKLSTEERVICEFIVGKRDEAKKIRDLQHQAKYFKNACFNTYSRSCTPDSYKRSCELMKYHGFGDALKIIESWKPPKFPVTGHMLANLNIKPGPVMTVVLTRLFQKWMNSEFQMTAGELIDAVKELPPLDVLEKEYKKKKNSLLTEAAISVIPDGKLKIFIAPARPLSISRILSSSSIQIQFLDGEDPNYFLFTSMNKSSIWKSSRINPFSNIYVGISCSKPYLVWLDEKLVDFGLLTSLFVGILLFCFATAISRSEFTYYILCSIVGFLLPLILLLFFIFRRLPLKTATAAFYVGGTGTFLYFLHSWGLPTLKLLLNYSNFIIAYLVVMSALSCAVVYRYLIPVHPKTVQLVGHFFSIIGIFVMFMSCQEVIFGSIFVVFVIFAKYMFIKKVHILNQKLLWNQPAPISFLSESEYINQGRIETARNLENLRAFARSPDFDTWHILGRLENTQSFVNGESDGIHESSFASNGHIRSRFVEFSSSLNSSAMTQSPVLAVTHLTPTDVFDNKFSEIELKIPGAEKIAV